MMNYTLNLISRQSGWKEMRMLSHLAALNSTTCIWWKVTCKKTDGAAHQAPNEITHYLSSIYLPKIVALFFAPRLCCPCILKVLFTVKLCAKKLFYIRYCKQKRKNSYLHHNHKTTNSSSQHGEYNRIQTHDQHYTNSIQHENFIVRSRTRSSRS